MTKSFCGLDDELHQELMERYENQKSEVITKEEAQKELDKLFMIKNNISEFELEPTREEPISYNGK